MRFNLNSDRVWVNIGVVAIKNFNMRNNVYFAKIIKDERIRTT